MPERAVGPGMRVLLGTIGAAALLGGVVVFVTAVRLLAAGTPAALPVIGAATAVLVVLGGLHLIRGAVRGRIAVRATRFGRSLRRHGGT